VQTLSKSIIQERKMTELNKFSGSNPQSQIMPSDTKNGRVLVSNKS
jgi:hypothetical protein